MDTNQNVSSALPIKRELKLAFTLTWIITLLMAGASLVGLLAQSWLYPSEELRQSLMPNDVVNLLVGLPVLLVSLRLARGGKLNGLLLWPGALVYVIYNTVAYLTALPFTWMSGVYFGLIALSCYTLIWLFGSIEFEAVGEQLEGKVPARTAGGISIAFGILFFFRVIFIGVDAQISQMPITPIELGTLIADVVISPLMVVGGVLLWRRKAVGYAAGLGLLFQASMLFIALIVLMLLQPILTSAPLALVDLLVVAAMGLVCFVPFGMYLRGVRHAKLM